MALRRIPLSSRGMETAAPVVLRKRLLCIIVKGFEV
jgi:hypothetical protein